ncbi:hypothetical protein FRB91_011738 [Serendipita sp. 411]|nr:hypothetical protein FRB91_011738 [Serendipita sp. 411]
MTTRSGKQSASGSRASQTSGSTCAECRRLKIRCDRKIPCDQCSRRNCASICPDGQLVPAYGGNRNNRVIGQVPTNIDAITRKLDLFSDRIQELEAALHTAHGRSSKEVHPLLAPDLVGMTKELADEPVEDVGIPLEGGEEEIMTLSFGSLLRGQEGGTRFFGPSAASTWLLNTDYPPVPDADQIMILPTSPLASPASVLQLRKQMEAYVPPPDILQGFVDSYFKYSLSLFQPLTPARLRERCLVTPIAQLPSRHLSLLFIVMSLAAQLDPRPPRSWLSASTYFRLSQACLSTQDTEENITLEVVEAMGLQSLFLLYHEGTAVPERAWITLGTAMKYAQAMGLHRDSRRWGLSEEAALNRRRTFYELWTFDILLSAYMGRPPSINRSQVDCEMPTDDLFSFGQNPTFYRWKHQFSSTILLELLTSVLSSTIPPDYSAIISLDKQLRAAPWLDRASSDPCHPIDPMNYPQMSVRWQEHAVFFMRTYALILLHRPFFARALIEAADDVFKHRFLRSVMTVHDSSRTFIRHIMWLSANEPETLRIQPFWKLYMICSIVSLGALVVKAPRCNLTIPALQSLEEGCDFLMKQEGTSGATRAMLSRLSSAARRSIASDGAEDPESHLGSPDDLSSPSTSRPSSSRRVSMNMNSKMEDIQFAPRHGMSIAIPSGPTMPGSSRATPGPSSDAFYSNGGVVHPGQKPLYIFDDMMRVESQSDQAGPLHHALYMNHPHSGVHSSGPPSHFPVVGSDSPVLLSYPLDPSPTTFQVPGFQDVFHSFSGETIRGTRTEEIDHRSWSQFWSSIGL